MQEETQDQQLDDTLNNRVELADPNTQQEQQQENELQPYLEPD